jgi:PKD domain
MSNRQAVMRGDKSAHTLSTILIILLFAVFLPFGPLRLPQVSGALTGPTVSVQVEDYFSPSVIDPSLVPGSMLNVTVEASGLPPITDQGSGGIQGFDMTLDYNASILKPVHIGSIAPFCSGSDDCLFANLTQTQVYTFANTTNSAHGTTRLGMLVYSQQNRATSDGILFKIQYQIIARGITLITLDQSTSMLIGFSQNCGSSITSYAVSNAMIDNRPPWRVLANPQMITLGPGGSGSVSITVVRVNSDANVSLFIPAGNTPVRSYTITPNTGLLNQQSGKLNFTSTLTLNIDSTAPPGSFVLQIIAHDTNTPGGFREYRLNYTVTISSTLTVVALTISSSLTDDGGVRQAPLSISPSVPSTPTLPLIANFTFAKSTNTTIIYAAIVCGGSPPYSYHWDFGDGTTGTGGEVSHTYTTSSTYTVTLTVTDANGASFKSSQQLDFNQPSAPIANLLLPIGIIAIILVASTIILIRRGKFSKGSRKTRK